MNSNNFSCARWRYWSQALTVIALVFFASVALANIAAMTACRDPNWKPYYQSLRDRGFSGTAALMALARKLVRVCYALLEKQVSFDPGTRSIPCNAT